MATTTPPNATEQYHFPILESGTSEHILRHGQAAPIREVRPLRYAGRLDTPQLWLEPKKEAYKPTDATVTVNYTKGEIQLVLLEKAELHDEVSGSLVVAPELELFSINTDKKYTLDELITLLKRYRFFFASKDAHSKLLDGLRNFSAKVDTKIENMRSNSGASKSNIEREVHGIEWDREFVLSVPVFKGYSSESFRVEVGVDATSPNLRFFLDSPELLELEQDLKRRLLGKEIEYFTTWGCSLIYVS